MIDVFCGAWICNVRILLRGTIRKSIVRIRLEDINDLLPSSETTSTSSMCFEELTLPHVPFQNHLDQ